VNPQKKRRLVSTPSTEKLKSFAREAALIALGALVLVLLKFEDIKCRKY